MKNNVMIKGKQGIITKENSFVAMVVPTNEELMIAQDVHQIVEEKNG